MGKYTKQTMSSGQVITSAWGNAVQEQFEDVVGVSSGEVTQFLAAILATDTRSINVTRTGGVITKIEEKSGSTVIITTTINRSNGLITSIVQTGDGKTITYTVNRTGGEITSITKGVI